MLPRKNLCQLLLRIEESSGAAFECLNKFLDAAVAEPVRELARLPAMLRVRCIRVFILHAAVSVHHGAQIAEFNVLLHTCRMHSRICAAAFCLSRV